MMFRPFAPKRRDLLLICLASALAALAIERFGSAPEVATLQDLQGKVERDHLGAEQRWQAAETGDTLAIGEAVRTGPGATARLNLQNGGSLELEPDSIVRFLSSEPGRPSVRIVDGAASFDSHDRRVQIETALGLLSLDEHSAVRVHMREGTAHLRVDVGHARFIDGAQITHPLLAGHELATRASPRPALDRAAQPPAASLREEPAAPADAGSAEPAVEPLEEAPLLGAAASDEVEAAATARAQRMAEKRGKKTAAAPARAAKPRKAKPSLLALARKLGSGRHEARPPTNTVELDGRRYTLLYQERLPAVAIRTRSSAPGRFVVQSGSRLRTFEAPQGSLRLDSGELGDGSHQVFFESAGYNQRSPITTIRIVLDSSTSSRDARGRTARAEQGGEGLHYYVRNQTGSAP